MRCIRFEKLLSPSPFTLDETQCDIIEKVQSHRKTCFHSERRFESLDGCENHLRCELGTEHSLDSREEEEKEAEFCVRFNTRL